MGDKRAVEEKEYLWADEGDNVLIELLLNSIETALRLNARLPKVMRLQKGAQERRLTSVRKPSKRR